LSRRATGRSRSRARTRADRRCTRLRFAGFDGPLEITGAASPRQALTALHGYLSARVDTDLLPCTAETLDHLLGADDRWTNPAAMMDPCQSAGQSAEAKELLLLAGDLVTLLDAQAPHLITATTRDGWDRARLYGRTATGLLRYHFWMADTSPSRMTRLVGLRDQMMADNLLASPSEARHWSTPTTAISNGTRARCGWATYRWSGGAPAQS